MRRGSLVSIRPGSMSSLRRLSSRFLVLSLSAFWLLSPAVRAQSAAVEGEVASPVQDRVAEIEKLTTTNEFVVAVKDYWKTGRSGLDEAATAALKRRLGEAAKRRLLAEGELSTLAIGDMSELLGWAAPVLSAQERQSLSTKAQELLAIRGWAEASNLDRAVTILEGVAGKDYRAQAPARAAVAEWIKKQDLSKQSRTRLEWCYRVLSPSIRGEDGFSVVWTGLLTPPTTGAYTFSTSDLKISCELNEGGHSEYHRQYLTVKIGDQTVLEATPQQWPARSKPIELKAGAAEALQVEFRYERNDSFKACPAVLYWEGPGFKRSVVPTIVLTAQGPTGKVPGLLGTYSWKSKLADGSVATTSETSIDPNIDFVWTEKIVVGAHSDALGALGQELARRWKASPKEFVDEVARRPAVVSTLSSSDLAACLAALNQSEVLKDVDATKFWRFWFGVRDAGGRDAVDSVGLWMHAHPFPEPVLTSDPSDYFEQYYDFHFRYGDFYGLVRADLLGELQKGYLQMEDGRCCLRAAYTCALAHVKQNRSEQWIEVIDSFLANKTLSGDARASWLIARAVAQELRNTHVSRLYYGRPLPLLGESFLQEATLIAKTAEMKDQALVEYAARLTAYRQFDAAEEIIGRAGSAALWQERLVKLKQSTVASEVDQQAAATAAYRATMQKRIAQAQSRGDQEAVKRLQANVEQLGAKRE